MTYSDSGPPVMSPNGWLEVITKEYLDTFVRGGGSALKIVTPRDELAREAVTHGLAASGGNLGYLVVRVDAAQTRIHMMDQLFFTIAAQVPWRQLSQHVVATLARDAGFAVPDDDGAPLLERLAAANNLDPSSILLELRPVIAERVFKYRRLSRDFRVAMTQLCLAELTGGADGEIRIQTILAWLDGSNNRVSAVRQYGIFNRITRTNARHLFESLLHWLRRAGYPGLLLVLDAARLTVARNPRDGAQYYSKPAVIDAYELLRQFIDATDRMHGCLIVVVPDVAFLEEDQAPRSRGIGQYDALKFRVIDEVRDRRLANPMASLVRLSSLTGGGAE